MGYQKDGLSVYVKDPDVRVNKQTNLAPHFELCSIPSPRISFPLLLLPLFLSFEKTTR